MFKDLRLSVAEAEKAIGVTREQLYIVINGRSAATPELAVRFEKAFVCGADRPPATSRKCARAKRRSPCAVSRGRFDVSHLRPAVVERIAERTAIGARAHRGMPRLHRCK